MSELTEHEKRILHDLKQTGAKLLFNIKGMVEIVYDKKPYDFVEMGYEDIRVLKEKGYLQPVHHSSYILQGEIYEMSEMGRKAI